MRQERWIQIEELFHLALKREPTERMAFLAEACGADAALRREVESLLLADDDAGSFLERGVEQASQRVHLAAGRRVGPYRIVGEIGQGGMGAVYRAIRDDDQYQKEVAIKLMRGEIQLGFLLERFKAERQILANLEHANIARLIDGGTTEEGWPYFSMEYVKGEPIDRYCEARDLSTRQRLELFLTVCSAVQYAHQRLVIHRDLKPSNILVTEEGIPKLLDFGIAKLLDDEGNAAMPLTALPIMTPEFASPEQVKGQVITTASDVYSLGLILYELLARQRAYQIKTRSPEEIARVVCQFEPERPSSVAPQAVSRQLTGDLDTIVLKAVRKEPSRRYASVLELSDDIRRQRSGLPVLARGDALSYRAGKFALRHKAGLTAAALVALSLILGIVATTRQARIAEANRAQAERRFNDVRKMANSFLFEFHQAIRDLPGSTPARELVVKRATEYLDSLSKEAQLDASLQRELATAYQRLGQIQAGVGANLASAKEALQSYGRARAIREALLKRRPVNPEDLEGIGEVEIEMGSAFIYTADLTQAESSLRGAVQRFEGLLASGQGSRDFRHQLSVAYHRLGFVQARRGDERAALESVEKSLSLGEAFSAAHPEEKTALANVAYIHDDLAERLGRAGQPQSALEHSRRARQIQEKLIEADPHNARYPGDLAYSLSLEGRFLLALGNRQESLESFRHSLALAEAQLAADPRNRWNQTAVVIQSNALGTALIATGQTQAGIEQLRQGARSAEAELAEDPTNGVTRNHLALIYTRLGKALQESATGSARTEGCRVLQRAVDLWNALESEHRAFADNRDDREAAVAAFARCPGRAR